MAPANLVRYTRSATISYFGEEGADPMDKEEVLRQSKLFTLGMYEKILMAQHGAK